jgi:nicotinate phosphoribosyltransferase
MFNRVKDDDILDGKATDAYFLRTEEAIEESGRSPEVVADVSADQFGDNEYEVLAGVNDAVKLLSNASNNIEVWTIPEGCLFDGGPVMRIRGEYTEFARFETSLLGFLSQASGIATNALRATQTANQSEGNPSVLSFGARHMHPAIASVIERSALIGGVDGFSHIAAGQEIGREASGTIPHALVLALDDQEEAWESFNQSAPEGTPRIVIADTFTDEADEAVRAAKRLGDDLDGVRLDTTGSRRGDFEHIIKETKWKLAEINRDDVDVFVSGGLTPKDISELGDYVDGFGIGGYISNANPVDFSLDIVRRNGKPTTKRGKLPGIKSVHRENGKHIVERSENPATGLFEKAVENGEVLNDYTIEQSMKQAHEDAEKLEFTIPKQ